MKNEQDTYSTLSVIVIAGAEEHNIGPCLESVRWAGEIIVLYSEENDRTAEIARSFTPHVHFRAFSGYAEQKQAALDMATQPWVLSLDADERVSEDLKREIAVVLASGSAADGYFMPRKNYFHGKWLRHGGWYPDPQLRLFRRNGAKVTKRLVHEGFVTDGRTARLQGHLEHYTLPRVGTLLRKNIDYSLYEATEKSTRRSVGVLDFLLRPLLEFFKKYFGQRGFLDGWEGLVVAVIHTLNKVQVLLYMWEIRRYGGYAHIREADEPEVAPED